MPSTSQLIAAIEIGSSKINGIIAETDAAGRQINVIFSHSEPISDSVRHGRIQNVMEVARDFNLMIRKLENAPGVSPRKINGIYLGLSGRSLGTVNASAETKLPTYMEISKATPENLSREARFGLAPDKEILRMIPKKYLLDGAEVKKIIGSLGSRVKAEYAAVVCAPVLKRNMECIKVENGRVIERRYIVSPVALADLVLSESEKQIGTLLMDFGDQTVTLSAYKNGVLQWLRTLPFGSRSITTDLMAILNDTEAKAREVKHHTASADPALSDSSSKISEIIECTSARTSEMIANIINIMDSTGVRLTDLPCGIVLCGGGARLADFPAVLSEQLKAKVRMADIDSSTVVTGDIEDRYMMLDVIAIAKAAAVENDMMCLTPLPKKPIIHEEEEEAENHPVTSDEDEDDNYTPVGRKGTRRNPDLDDDDLLDDDPDDEDDDERYNRRTKRPKKTPPQKHKDSKNKRPAQRGDEPVEDISAEDDDPYVGTIGRWKLKIAKWLSSEPKDDLEDDPDYNPE